MGAYVMLAIVIFVLVYSLTICEVAVTFPDTSCFVPVEAHSAGQTVSLHQFLITPSMFFCIILFTYKVFILVNNGFQMTLPVVYCEKHEKTLPE